MKCEVDAVARYLGIAGMVLLVSVSVFTRS